MFRRFEAMDEIIRSEPLYEKLKQKLIERIENEKPDILPCEKELIAHYKVSRNTVRRAISDLENEGYLKAMQGIGTIVFPKRDVTENSIILVICDRDIYTFQQETFNALMAKFNDYRLNAMMIMIDKEHPDEVRLKSLLAKASAVVIDQLTSFSVKIHEIIRSHRIKCLCLRWQPSVKENYIAEDVASGFYKLIKHLLSNGHRDIAFISNMEDERRMPGIRKAMAEFKCPLNKELVVNISKGFRHEGYEAAGKLLSRKKRFTAVVCHNDAAALGVMERLLIAGLRIPEDISVTGFDNIRESSVYPVPLTSCGASVDRIVTDSIKFLFRSSSDDNLFEMLIEPELIVRESTGKAKS